MIRSLITSALLLSTTAFAEHTNPEPRDHNDQNQYCYTNTTNLRTYQSPQCRYSNEVMVGFQSTYPIVIICAELQVNCRNDFPIRRNEKSEK